MKSFSNIRFVSIVMFSIILLICCSQTPDDDKSIALIHAVIIDGNGNSPIEDGTILINNGKIEAAGPFETVRIPSGTRTIDLKGKTVMPALSDMHVHLCGGWDGVSVDILGYQRYLNSLLYAGVTTVLDMGNVSPFSLQMRQEINAGRIPGPRIITAGPLVDGPDPIWPPISYSVSSLEVIPKIVKQLKRDGVDFIKAYAGLTEKMVIELVKEAKAEGLKTFIHKPRNVSLKDLMKTGVEAIAHMPSRDLSGEVIDLMKKNNVACITTLTVVEYGSFQRFADLSFLDHPLIKDTTPPWFMEKLRELKPREDRTTERLKKAQSNAKILFDAGILLVAGTDAPYPGVFQGEGVHREMELLVEAGLTPLEAISVATKNAAILMNLEDQWGTLAAGKIADLLIINGRPDRNISESRNVEMVIQAGKILDRERLKFDIMKDPGFRVATSVSASQ